MTNKCVTIIIVQKISDEIPTSFTNSCTTLGRFVPAIATSKLTHKNVQTIIASMKKYFIL